MSKTKRTAEAARASAPPRKLDLSRIRHDLRTPINHILGYCEMLLEEESVPRSFISDLRKIHTSGRQLVSLINEYFDDETFETKTRDVHQLCHELRTPVNHIIGYSEILQDQAEDIGRKKFIPDLKKIHAAATTWLALMEEHLITPGSSPAVTGAAAESSLILNQGVGFQAPQTPNRAAPEGSLLVVDDDESNRDMLARRLRRDGFTVTLAANGMEALKLIRSEPFDLVLLDLIMPGLDGYQVLVKMKSDAALRDIPVIMISALDQENGVVRCIELGAEDYLSKPFNPVFLRARLGAALEKRRLRKEERAAHAALERSEQHLAGELAKAAHYVRSLLPAPLSGAVQSEWSFQPSDQLGGDAFGYHWMDDEHLAIYLLDVCGHGVGAALLSVSALNTLRSEALPGTDFLDPAAVLSSLNRAFPMERQNHLYFTLWYGVYDRTRRGIRYASGGHPAALLLEAPKEEVPAITALATAGPAIGCFHEARFTSMVQPVAPGARLLVFSDGVFEIFLEHDRVQTWETFLKSFGDAKVVSMRPAERLEQARKLRGSESLEDDFSLMEFCFH